MAKPALGTGERFKALVAKLRARGITNPKALASWIGRKKYGKKRFQQLAIRGKKRKAQSKLEKVLNEA